MAIVWLKGYSFYRLPGQSLQKAQDLGTLHGSEEVSCRGKNFYYASSHLIIPTCYCVERCLDFFFPLSLVLISFCTGFNFVSFLNVLNFSWVWGSALYRFSVPCTSGVPLLCSAHQWSAPGVPQAASRGPHHPKAAPPSTFLPGYFSSLVTCVHVTAFSLWFRFCDRDGMV